LGVPYANDTVEEFRDLVHNSFKGMVHPEDLDRVQREIQEQVKETERKMDFIRFRIITGESKMM